MNIPYVMKKCGTCGRWLVASTVNFHKHKDQKYGLQNKCKECRKNEYRAKNNPANTDPNITKVCTKCGKEFPATEEYFCKHKNGKYGLYSQCRKCRVEHRSQYYREHKDEAVEYSRQWRKNNPDKVAENSRQWRKNNPDKVAEITKRQNKKRRQARIDAIIAQKRAEYEAERAPLVAEKTCRCCGRTLPASEFYANKKSKDHLGSYCKECHKKKGQENYYHNLETKGWA